MSNVARSITINTLQSPTTLNARIPSLQLPTLPTISPLSHYTTSTHPSDAVKEKKSSFANPEVKRFWKKVGIVEVQDANAKTNGNEKMQKTQYAITLDGRKVKTPLKQNLIVPSKLLAHLIALEWDSQSPTLKPFTMPFTSLACTVIDKKNSEKRTYETIIDDITKYFETDTLCFFSDKSNKLLDKQEKKWKPIIEWAEKQSGVKIETTTGLFLSHPEETNQKFYRFISQLNDWQIVGFEEMVRSSKSFLIGLALINRAISVHQAADLCRLEVLHQIEQWGAVEDSHDVDYADIRLRLGSAALFFRLTSTI